MRLPQAAALIAVSGLLAVGVALLLNLDPQGAPSVGPTTPETAARPAEGTQSPALEAPSTRAEDEVSTPGGERSAVGASEAGDPDTEEEDGRPGLRGRVVGPFGQPVPGARVFAAPAGLVAAIDTLGDESPWGFRRDGTESGPDGRFEVGLSGGGKEVQVAVRAAGFAPLRIRRTFTGERPFDFGDLVLETTVFLSGHVLDTSGRGVADAELHAAPAAEEGLVVILQGTQGTLVGTTDTSGAFELDELAAGRYSIEVRHPDHPSERFEGVTEAPGEVLGGIVVTLERGESVSGTVQGIPDGTHPEYIVHAGHTGVGGIGFGPGGPDIGRVASVESDGSFHLRGLHAGRDVGLRVLESEGVAPFGKACSETVLARGGDSGVVLSLRQGLTLTFRVVEAGGGAAVSDFEVDVGAPWPEAVRDADGKRLTHHPDGIFRHDGLDLQAGVDSVVVRVGSDDHLPWERTVPLPEGWEIDLGTVRLVPAPLVRVRVVDAETGDAVGGARVSLTAREPVGGDEGMFGAAGAFFNESETRRGRTDDEGRVALAAVSDGACLLEATHKSYADHPGEEIGPVLGGAGHVMRLSRGGRVEVLVVEADGQPRAGARVRHRGPSSEPGAPGWGGAGVRTTSEEGRVVYRRLTAGAHRFRLAADRRGGAVGIVGNASVVIGGGEPDDEEGWEGVTVVDGATIELTLVSEPRGSLAGRVSEGGRPLSGARLSIVSARDEGDLHSQAFDLLGGGSPNASTDGEGRYELDDVTVGDYRLRISHPTRTMAAEFEVEVEGPGGRFDVDLDLAVIEGRVSDGAGRGLAGARVVVERSEPPAGSRHRTRILGMFSGGSQMALGIGGGDTSVTTDADGRYRLRGVATRVDLVVRASLEGHQGARSETLAVGSDETRSGVDITLEGAGGLRVTVVDGSGRPPAFCRVTASFAGEEEGEVPDADQFVQGGGPALLDGLRPGSWAVSVQAMGLRSDGAQPRPQSEPRRVEVREGEVSEVELVLP
jgi:hypothetical protein